MKKEIKRILTALVKLDTITGHYKSIDYCYSYLLKELSWYPFQIKTYVHNHVKSIVWSTNKGLYSQVILNAHLDVVPGKSDLFKLQERDGNWYGRGVMDMKFALATYIVALKNLYKNTGKLPSLAIMVTSDEEVGGENGVKYLLDKIGYSANIVIVPDGGSNLHIVTKAKGVLHLKVKTTGKSSHASEPWKGKSANDELIIKLYNIRQKYSESYTPTDEVTTVIGTINGGKQTNQLSDYATATLDIRYPTKHSMEALLKDLRKTFGKDNIITLVSADLFSTDVNNSYIKSWAKLIRSPQNNSIYTKECSTTDGRYFATHNMPVIICQPEGGNTHSDNEHINIKSLVDYTEILIEWLENIDLENIHT